MSDHPDCRSNVVREVCFADSSFLEQKIVDARDIPQRKDGQIESVFDFFLALSARASAHGSTPVATLVVLRMTWPTSSRIMF